MTKECQASLECQTSLKTKMLNKVSCNLLKRIKPKFNRKRHKVNKFRSKNQILQFKKRLNKTQTRILQI